MSVTIKNIGEQAGYGNGEVNMDALTDLIGSEYDTAKEAKEAVNEAVDGCPVLWICLDVCGDEVEIENYSR